MKDAFGGTFILYIMLVFFVIFICFLTVSINFAKAFRIKNDIVNMLERKEVKTIDNTTVDEIDKYLHDIGYSYTNMKSRGVCTDVDGGETLTLRGVCVKSYHGKNDTTGYVYYKVTTYIVMDFPIFHWGGVIPISGETKLINDVNPFVREGL